MMKTLNDYYHVKLVERPQSGLLLSLDNEKSKSIRLAIVQALPKENELGLSIGSVVYVQQHYGQVIDDNDLVIKQDYIIAEYYE